MVVDEAQDGGLIDVKGNFIIMGSIAYLMFWLFNNDIFLKHFVISFFSGMFLITFIVENTWGWD